MELKIQLSFRHDMYCKRGSLYLYLHSCSITNPLRLKEHSKKRVMRSHGRKDEKPGLKQKKPLL